MTYIKFVIWLGLITLTAGVLLGCKDKPQSPPPSAEPNSVAQQPAAQPKPVTVTNMTPTPPPLQPPQVGPVRKPTLETIVAYGRDARLWQPAYVNWYGKMAPDFTVTDITGKSHKLSNYRGKNVMLIFWAVWCGPCRQEIPSLIDLRKSVGEDKLAMLAISTIGYRSSTENVKKFVAANPVINYTIISTDADSMPSPYNSIYAIPTTFFISPDGTIKIVTEGLTPLPHIKAILDAEQ
jgi:peroxiredoxin